MLLGVVMSKERELIEKLCSSEKTYSDWLLLRLEAIEFLTKPEQKPEQEPVGYLYKQMDCTGEWATIFKVDKPYITWHDIKDIVPLYTAPPKRELLGDGITADMYRANKKATHPDSYWAGVYDAEKAHGIGGGE